MILRILLLPIFICFVGMVSCAQQSSSPCPQRIPYIGKGDVTSPDTYNPVRVFIVEGQLLASPEGKAQNTPEGMPQPVPYICVALFTEQNHKFLGSAVTDKYGEFRFSDVPVGSYRVVVRAPRFYVVDMPVRVVERTKDGPAQMKPIYIVLQYPVKQK